MIKYLKYFSLEGGRIQLNKTDPNACGATIQHAKYSDSGTWNIVTFLCSRGRGKNQDQAIVVVDRGNIIYTVIFKISLYSNKYLYG